MKVKRTTSVSGTEMAINRSLNSLFLHFRRFALQAPQQHVGGKACMGCFMHIPALHMHQVSHIIFVFFVFLPCQAMSVRCYFRHFYFGRCAIALIRTPRFQMACFGTVPSHAAEITTHTLAVIYARSSQYYSSNGKFNQPTI
jgi:hypothetical protein